jgi:hypothetical protein
LKLTATNKLVEDVTFKQLTNMKICIALYLGDIWGGLLKGCQNVSRQKRRGINGPSYSKKRA